MKYSVRTERLDESTNDFRHAMHPLETVHFPTCDQAECFSLNRSCHRNGDRLQGQLLPQICSSRYHRSPSTKWLVDQANVRYQPRVEPNQAGTISRSPILQNLLRDRSGHPPPTATPSSTHSRRHPNRTPRCCLLWSEKNTAGNDGDRINT